MDSALRHRLREVAVAGAVAAAGLVATLYVAAGSSTLGLYARDPWPDGVEAALRALGPGARWAPRQTVLAGFLLLTVAWAVTLLLAERGRLRIRAAVVVASVWSLPLLLASPLISRDVYAYLGQGAVAAHGLDPYRMPPAVLGPGGFVASMDPMWRHTTSPYGPVALLVDRFAAGVSGGDVFVGVLVLRVVTVAAIVAMVWAVARLLPGRHRAGAVVALAGAPLVLVHFVSAAHVDALVAAGVATALLAEARERPRLALVLATLATQVKVVAALAVAALVLRHLLDAAPEHRWRTLARDLPAVAVPALLLAVVVPDGFGWVRGLGAASSGYLAVSATSLAWRAATSVAGHVAMAPWRTGGLVVAVLVDAWLLVTVRRRPLALTVGATLAVLAVLAPAAWPWYLTWSLPALALVPGRAARVWVVGVAAAGWALTLPFLPVLEGFRIELVAVVAVTVVVVGAVLVTRLRLRGPVGTAG